MIIFLSKYIFIVKQVHKISTTHAYGSTWFNSLLIIDLLVKWFFLSNVWPQFRMDDLFIGCNQLCLQSKLIFVFLDFIDGDKISHRVYNVDSRGLPDKRLLFALLIAVSSILEFLELLHQILCPTTLFVVPSYSEKVSAGIRIIRIYTQAVRLTFNRLSHAFILEICISTNGVIYHIFV